METLFIDQLAVTGDHLLTAITILLTAIGTILLLLLNVQIKLNTENSKEHEGIRETLIGLVGKSEQIEENKKCIKDIDKRVYKIEDKVSVSEEKVANIEDRLKIKQ